MNKYKCLDIHKARICVEASGGSTAEGCIYDAVRLSFDEGRVVEVRHANVTFAIDPIEIVDQVNSDGVYKV